MSAAIQGLWRRLVLLTLIGAAALSMAGTAQAHANGTSYLRIGPVAQAGALSASWDIAVADLELPLELDADGDGRLAAGEIAARRSTIARFAMERLAIRRGGADCRSTVSAIETRPREGQSYLSLHLAIRCPREGALGVATSLFFGSAGYSALLDVQTPGGRFPAVLSPATPDWSEPAAETWLGSLWRFAQEGIRHVLTGYDHIAFLVLLLLPSVLRGSGVRRSVVVHAREATRDLVWIVTAFTIAHSITLGLAVTGLVRLPVQPVELAIAGSIVVAGVVNLFAGAARWRLAIAFGFGLVHGFGFANAFREIGGDGARLAPMLGGFNLGVEAGQLLIVAACLPVLWLLARSPRYASRIMPGLSLATALTGAVWFAGRW